MVETPVRRHSTRHRRVASIFALRDICNTSPVRPAERRWIERDRRNRTRAALLRGMREVLGLLPRRRRRQQPPPRADPAAPIVLSSDTSSENLPLPQQQVVLVDLDSSIETLPDIDSRPQHQLPVQQLVEPVSDQSLEDLDITREFPPPLQHQVLREAYVLLQRLQLPPLQPLTPPPERPLTQPPVQEVDWVELEGGLAAFDALQQSLELPPPLILQQPAVVPFPQLVPFNFVPPLPLPQVDWAMVAYSLFLITEREHQQRHGGL